ncbi:MAG: Gfo/Idh/MocA family oxidoreductase [Bryobacterales bacterium]|nr:Gfo/Idh/MocA family oxidoreductase [Bryobacteraceae bacterium]MDW8131554.1 Gfo/Idh/MocA family oxidoreductase [Bryobacterales bacterium]
MRRRTFLSFTAASLARVRGANDRLRAGLIGAGGRGRLLAAEFKEIGVEVAAVCDVYQPNLDAGLKAASSGARPYRDYRRMLEDRTLDIVVIATPDHWHARQAVDAVEAGKDVYVEKPMAHTIEESFQMVEAVRRTRRVLQVGTQRRSFDLFLEAKRIMDSGRLGEIRLVNSWWYNHQPSLSRAQLRGELDWEGWLGPAPRRPLDPVRFHNWYYYWDYSGGLMVGQGAHIFDAIQWFMNSTYPEAVTCAACRPNLEGAEVPETTCVCVEYPERYLAVFTCGYKAMRYPLTNDQMVQYNGTKARFDVGRESYALYLEDPKALDPQPVEARRSPGAFASATRAHIRNFLEAVRDRKDPSAPVEAGHYVTVVLSMAKEALHSGRRLRWDAATRRVVA